MTAHRQSLTSNPTLHPPADPEGPVVPAEAHFGLICWGGTKRLLPANSLPVFPLCPRAPGQSAGHNRPFGAGRAAPKQRETPSVVSMRRAPPAARALQSKRPRSPGQRLVFRAGRDRINRRSVVAVIQTCARLISNPGKFQHESKSHGPCARGPLGLPLWTS